MSKLVIAVDIDEVLVHHNKTLAKWHNENFNTNHTELDYVKEAWSEAWGVNKEEAERRSLMFHTSGMHDKMDIIGGAHDALKELGLSHDLIIVTARRQSIKDSTRVWINRNFPNIFQEVHFVPYWETNYKATKAEVCHKIGANLLIDDSVSHCVTAVDSGLGAVLFGHYPWNAADDLHSEIKRVKNWQEAVNHLKK